MINNRQGGRRRGRGGGGRAPNSGPNPGNRQDNRQRGNAAQLLEKYRQLARDAQMQGDRVQSEYYLQFADHYFRVLNENRARFEEHRRTRDDEFGDEDEGEDETVAAEADGEESQPQLEDQQRSRRFREDGERNGEQRFGDGQRRRRGRRDFNGEEAPRQESETEAESRIALDSLPPAISPAPSDDEGDGEEAPRPRRRTRRPRGEEGETTPAAA